MTRLEIIGIISNTSDTSIKPLTYTEAADRIQAAYDGEKKREVRDGWNIEFKKGQSTITLLYGVEHEGKKGHLIFRPDGE